MFKFRALEKHTNQLVFGFLSKTNNYPEYFIGDSQIIPETLGVTYSGLTDKNGTEIYASFEIDGQMTKGGDVVKVLDIITSEKDKGEMIFDSKAFCIDTRYSVYYNLYFDHIEIIGKQWEAKK